MKKSKLLLVITLGLVLAMLTFTTSTFSWFSRAEGDTTATGNALAYEPTNMPISTGGVSMSTQMLDASGEPTGDDPVANFSNNSGIANGKRVSYRTTLTNSSNTDQSVSLYISKLSDISGGNFYLGVNDPLKTYKQYRITSASPAKTSKRGSKLDVLKQNVYVGLHKDEIKKLTAKNPEVHAWNDKGEDKRYAFSSAANTGGTGNYKTDYGWKNEKGELIEQIFNIYAYTVSSYCTDFKLSDDSITGDYDKSQSTISTNNTIIYYEYSGIYYAESRMAGKAAKISSFYSTADVVISQPLLIQAEGENITYSSSNQGIATVDPTTGQVTGVSAGSVDIIATSTGVYGDTITATCKVTVYDNNVEAFDGTDVPIITNVKVPGKNQNDGSPGQVTIDWFIKNDGGLSPLKYEIKSVYLTL